MPQRLSSRVTYLLIIMLAPSPIPRQTAQILFDIIHSVWMQFYVMTRTHVGQFTLVPIAKCHSTKLWIMSSYFLMNGFKATVCASTEDNQHTCAPTRWWSTLGFWPINWLTDQESIKMLSTANLAENILNWLIVKLQNNCISPHQDHSIKQYI